MSRARLGQHFLVEASSLKRLADLADGLPGEIIVEIGCGTGNLTERLSGKRIIGIEVDPVLARKARERFLDDESIRIIEEDILDVDLSSLSRGVSSIKLVGNLPYCITHRIIQKVLDEKESIASVLFLVQREVATRLAASLNSRASGRISVQWTRWFDSRIAGSLDPRCFKPAPKVMSSILVCVKRDRPAFQVADEKQFQILLKSLFQHRRKSIKCSLRLSGIPGDAVEALLSAASVSGQKRPEALEAGEWERLASALRRRAMELPEITPW